MDQYAIDAAAARRAAKDKKRKAKEPLAYASEDDESVEHELPPPPTKRTKKEKRAESRRKAKQWADQERLKANQMWLPAAAGPVAVACVPKKLLNNVTQNKTIPAFANTNSRVAAPVPKKPVAYVPPPPAPKKPAAFAQAPNRAAAKAPPPPARTLRPAPFVPPPVRQRSQAPIVAPPQLVKACPKVYHDVDEVFDAFDTAEPQVQAVVDSLPVVEHEPKGIYRVITHGRRLCNNLQAKLLVGLKLLILALGAVAVVGLLASITMHVVGGIKTTTGSTTGFTSAFDRCFVNTGPSDVAYSARCSGSAAAKQLIPCPPGGICEGGKLIACGLDMSVTGTALTISHDGMSCELTVDAAIQFQTLVDHLQELSVANMCGETPSIKIRNQGSSTSSSAMFDYFDVVQGLQVATSGAGSDAEEWFDSLSWLKFVLDNKLASGLTLDWKPNEPILIGLSPDAMQQLTLPSTCVAQLALVSSLESTTHLLWDIITWTCKLVWSLFLASPGYCIGLASLMYLGITCYSNRQLSRQRKDEIERGLELVEKYLKMGRNTWINVNTIRDTVKTQLYPGDRAAQSLFVSRSWKRVSRIMEKDERVRVRNHIVDGNLCDVWMWQGLMD